MKNMCTPALTAPFPPSLIWDLILCYWHNHYLPKRSEIYDGLCEGANNEAKGQTMTYISGEEW